MLYVQEVEQDVPSHKRFIEAINQSNVQSVILH